MHSESQALTIDVPGHATVSALLDASADPRSLFIFAHGAGAGMSHAFMSACALGLAARDIGVLRYQFPSMERGSGRPDSPAVAHATVRAAVARAAELMPGARLFAGGKSFGGRMTSQAQAAAPLPGVAGLIFIGFPLHPAGKPSIARAAHLDAIALPMLFLQGTRDTLAETHLLEPVVSALGDRATLTMLPDADHGFHVRKSSGTSDAETLATMLDGAAAWMVAAGS